MERVLSLGCDQAGTEVVYGKSNEHVDSHFGETPKLEALVRVAIETTVIPPGADCHTVEFPQPFPVEDCGNVVVENRPGDEIIFVQRHGRRGKDPYVLNRQPEPCNLVTMILAPQEDQFTLITAYIGPHAPPSPNDRNVSIDSIPFWRTHSFVWGHNWHVPETGTDEPPFWYTD